MSDRAPPIIDLAYRLARELNRAVGGLPRNERPGSRIPTTFAGGSWLVSNCKGSVKCDPPGVIHVARRDKGDSTAATVTLATIYVSSDDIVAREIEGEIVIIPLTAGIGDAEDELYTLNETGHAIWRKLDGARTLGAIVDALAQEFATPRADIASDVLGLASELTRRRILAVKDEG